MMHTQITASFPYSSAFQKSGPSRPLSTLKISQRQPCSLIIKKVLTEHAGKVPRTFWCNLYTSCDYLLLKPKTLPHLSP